MNQLLIMILHSDCIISSIAHTLVLVLHNLDQIAYLVLDLLGFIKLNVHCGLSVKVLDSVFKV